MSGKAHMVGGQRETERRENEMKTEGKKKTEKI
jgi:hypothetical protein